MREAIAIALVVLFLVLSFQLGPSLQDSIDGRNAYLQQQRALELEQQRYAFDKQRVVDSSTFGAVVVSENFYKIIIPAIIVVGLFLLADMYHKRSEPLVSADSRGLFPLPRKLLTESDDAPLLQAAMLDMAREHIKVAQLAAIHQPGQTPAQYAPHWIHNPTFAPRYASTLVDLDGEAGVEREGPHPNVPPFSKLLHQGFFGGSAGIMLGISTNPETGEPGDPIYGTDNDVASAAIGGVRGSGKTTTAAFLAGQWVMFQGKLVVCDPHARAEGPAQLETLAYALDPLKPAYACDVAVDSEQILESAKYVKDLLEQRIKGASYDDRIMLILDEFSSVMREGGESAEVITHILEKIATNGRKFHITAVLLGQQWHVKRAGGGPLKDVLATAWLHRMLRKTANQIIPLGQEMPETSTLQVGEAYFYRGQLNLEHIYIPYTTRDDLLLVAPRLQPAPAGPREPARDFVDPDVENAKSRRIVAMFRSNVDPTKIVEEVFGIRGGRAFKPAIDEVYATLRRELERSVN